MSRSKHTMQRFIIYLAIAIVLLYLFVRFGLQAFINIAFYLTSRGTAVNNVTTVQKNARIVTDPVLEEVPHATNEASLQIFGHADPDNQIYLYHNQKRINTLNADYEGNFDFFIEFEEGKNEIYVKSYNIYNKKSRKSNLYAIVYLSKEPTLELLSIEDGKKFYNPDIVIEGQTDKEVFVRINGVSVVIKADGSFSHPLSLKEGENIIQIQAEDIAGNIMEKEIRVFYTQ